MSITRENLLPLIGLKVRLSTESTGNKGWVKDVGEYHIFYEPESSSIPLAAIRIESLTLVQWEETTRLELRKDQ